MATLVLSSVGTALGGPVGSAIGALLGQSIDQAILSPVRRGPRVGDLSVQSSSFGTQIPRIYGSMRVAGTVVWATNLIESEQVSGAKGQPDVTYSYSVSLAVALSSRQAKSIGRIWADGKLLRGAAGDFKVNTQFRFYDGSDDQALDPLIGSIEGIASTPAYRGIALAVFENLQLVEFGNRIPMMTFEVLADEEPPSVASILSDASSGAIQSDGLQQVAGFAAYGRTIRSAVEPLVDCFGVELFDDGTRLRSPSNMTPLAIAGSELGNDADGKQVARLEREQVPSSELPGVLRMTYYDAARDYQTGEAQAAAGEWAGAMSQKDLAAVLDAAAAKALAHDLIARAWAERDRLTLRLPPSRLAIEPGSRIELNLSPSQWRVEKASVEGFVVVAELRPESARSRTIVGDGGRVAQNPDVLAQPLDSLLLDLPAGFGPVSNDPTICLAATSASGWQRQTVEIALGGQMILVDPARTKSIVGCAEGILAQAAPDLIDAQSEVIVALTDHDQWLTSCDDEALFAGGNQAMLGSELLQFGAALPLGGGRFRLSRLLRGRFGTEWAISNHIPGEPFCLLKPGTLQPVVLPVWSVGATLSATPRRGSGTSMQFLGECLRPPSPVNLAVERLDSGDLILSWTRRSRQGFAWVDGIDAPLGESSEQYRVNVTGSDASLDQLTAHPLLVIAAADLLTLGPGGGLTIEVRQIGDAAASRPATLTLN